MKTFVVTITNEQRDFLKANCIVLSNFLKIKLDNLIKNQDKFNKI